jgi:hypothetical protein
MSVRAISPRRDVEELTFPVSVAILPSVPRAFITPVVSLQRSIQNRGLLPITNQFEGGALGNALVRWRCGYVRPFVRVGGPLGTDLCPNTVAWVLTKNEAVLFPASPVSGRTSGYRNLGRTLCDKWRILRTMTRLRDVVRARFLLHVGLMGLSTILLTGCPNPQTYGTPRTTPPGKVTHTIAAETMTVSGTTKTSDTDYSTGEETEGEERVSATFPVPPTYQLRIGLADRVDLGIKVANMTSLGADIKLNPVRGGFDFAIAPGVQWFRLSAGGDSLNVTYLHLPLMFGVNLSTDTSLIFTPGVVYVAAGTSEGADGNDAIFQSSGLGARFGIGFEYRVSPKFALHPELTAIRGLTGPYGDVEATIVLFGLGFNIANIPDYSDVDS